MAHRNRGFTYEKWWFSRNPPGISRTPWAAEPWLCSQKGTVAPRSHRAKLATGDNLDKPEKHGNTVFLQLSDLSDGEWEKKRKPTLSDGTSCGKTHDLRATQSKHAVRCCRGTQLCRCNQVHLNLAMLHRGTRDQFMVPDLWCRAVPISIIINHISIRSALS